MIRLINAQEETTTWATETTQEEEQCYQWICPFEETTTEDEIATTETTSPVPTVETDYQASSSSTTPGYDSEYSCDGKYTIQLINTKSSMHKNNI